MGKPDTGIVTIHGKEYETVALRVQKFRGAHPDHGLQTEIVHRGDDDVVMKATITDETGRVIATGYAEEKRSASTINRTSALENCETSSIGRALAAFGYGGTEYATANEVQGAIQQQDGMRDAMVANVVKAISDDDPEAFLVAIKADEELWKSVFSRSLNTKQKAAARDLEQRGFAQAKEYADGITEAASRDDAGGMSELTDELTDGMKKMVWAQLSAETRAKVKALKEQSQ